MSGVVADTSVWIDFFAGKDSASLEASLAEATVALPPIVVAELISGARQPSQRSAIVDLLREIPLHETDVGHWLRVGELRLELRAKGLSLSTPDAHVAQCALDGDALLLTKDRVFSKVAQLTALRVAQ